MTLKQTDVITDILARLENIELREELHDAYFQNTTLPALKNNNIIKKFGTLTQDQLNQLIANALQGADIKNTPKWLQLLFGSILSQPVRLATYLAAKKKVIEAMSNYKSYIALIEDVKVDPATRNRDMLFLRDSNILVAYVRTVYDDIYVGGVFADQYKNYTSIGNNPTPNEGLAVKRFGYAIVNTIKQQAGEAVLSKLTTDAEKQVFQALLNDASLNTLLADVCCLAATDALNQGSLNERYGNTFKAAEALKSNNLLQNISGVESLAMSNPEMATDIETKLAETSAQKSRYWVDPRKLKLAKQKINSTQNPNTASINNFVSTYQNLVSYVGKCLGDTKIDLDTFFVLEPEEKKNAILNASGIDFYTAINSETGTIRNGFLRIVTRDMAHCFGISPDVAHGWTFISPDGSTTSNRVLVVKDSIAKDLKTPLLDNSVHNYIVHEASKRYSKPQISPGMYAQTFADAETKSDAQQNAGQGQKTVKEQLLNVLDKLFDEPSQKLKTDFVLFAAVPSIVALGARLPLLVSDQRALDTPLVMNESPNNPQSAAFISSLKPMSYFYNAYMDVLLNPTSKDEIRAIKQSFFGLIQNLAFGAWSFEGLEKNGVQRLAGFSAFNMSASVRELRYHEDFFDDKALELIIKAANAKEATEQKVSA